MRADKPIGKLRYCHFRKWSDQLAGFKGINNQWTAPHSDTRSVNGSLNYHVRLSVDLFSIRRREFDAHFVGPKIPVGQVFGIGLPILQDDAVF